MDESSSTQEVYEQALEMVQLADWITKLEPHIVQVWLVQSWNMSFNISVKFSDHGDRWRWVQRGMELLRDEALRYNPEQPLLYAESFSPNTPEGVCPRCHGLGRVYEATEASMVPDDTKTIRERAIAAWPQAWGGQKQRDILVTLGYDVDRPWRDLPQDVRDWILFTDEQPPSTP